ILYVLKSFLCDCYSCYIYLYFFPTRRSSDLGAGGETRVVTYRGPRRREFRRVLQCFGCALQRGQTTLDLAEGRKLGLIAGLLPRSEEHTSELQSRENLVCRLLLEKKK